MDWSTFWTAVGSVAAVLAFLAPIAIGIGRWIRRQFTREIEAMRDENRRLREDLETRLRLPSFSLDAIRLTELAAERRIEELTAQLNEAVAQRDEPRASELEAQLKEVEALRGRLDVTTAERDRLRAQLQDAIVVKRPPVSGNGIGLQTGLILLVRHRGRYGAVQAVQHAVTRDGGNGNFVRYVSWYQPDGTGVFTSESSLFGTGLAHEGGPAGSTMLRVGPIELHWSAGGNHFGWVYFGPSSSPSPEYELAQTAEIDISKVNAASGQYNFLKRG